MLDALRFLTVLPVGSSDAVPSRASLVFFPAVGLLVGGLWALPGVAFDAAFPSAGVIAALVLIVDAAVTGGLHLDALADVADGAGSRRGGDEAIAVMRDPAIGALGAVTLILVCLLRFGALTFTAGFPFRLFAAPVAGRAAMVLLLTWLPSRHDGSLAQAFGRPGTGVLMGAAVTTALCLAPSGLRGFAAFGAAAVVTAAYAWWWRRRFGGLNGDGAGAGGLIAETTAMVVLAAG